MQGQGQAAVPAPPDRGADPGTVPLPSPASRTGAASVLSGPSLEILGTPSLSLSLLLFLGQVTRPFMLGVVWTWALSQFLQKTSGAPARGSVLA